LLQRDLEAIILELYGSAFLKADIAKLQNWIEKGAEWAMGLKHSQK
jgi:hypothetical protein